MIHELQQELWVDTPKGRALALAWIDRGPHSDLEWVCVLEKTGEVWSPKNYDIRVCPNWTMGIRRDPPDELRQFYGPEQSKNSR